MQIDTHSHTHTQHSTHGKTFTILFSDFFPPRNTIVDGWISLLILRSRARPHTRVHKTTNIIGGFEIEISDTRRGGNHLASHSNDHVVKSRSINVVACGGNEFPSFPTGNTHTITSTNTTHCENHERVGSGFFLKFFDFINIVVGCCIFLNRWSLVGKAEERGDDTCEANDIQLGTEDQGRDGGKVKAPFFFLFFLTQPPGPPPLEGRSRKGEEPRLFWWLFQMLPQCCSAAAAPPFTFLEMEKGAFLGWWWWEALIEREGGGTNQLREW